MRQVVKVLILVLILFGVHAFPLRPATAVNEWRLEWEKTIEAAKREGGVVIYGPHNPMYRSL